MWEEANVLFLHNTAYTEEAFNVSQAKGGWGGVEGSVNGVVWQ